MFDLNAILDEMRSLYYCSCYTNRPSISWSSDYWTDCFGCYDMFDNHITISRILDDKSVTKEMISSVIYHESLHQDYPEHNRWFSEKAKLFPNYDDLFTQLQNYAERVHSEIQYSAGYNQFTNGKKSVIYIFFR